MYSELLVTLAVVASNAPRSASIATQAILNGLPLPIGIVTPILTPVIFSTSAAT